MSDGLKTILIVEDDPGHVALLKRRLEDSVQGYKLMFASSLDQARAYVDEHSPDLVMTDLVLPDGNGIALLEDVIERRVQVPVVVMTSQGNEQTAVEVLKRGALDYIVKSDRMFDDIQHVIDRALREWTHITQRRRAEFERDRLFKVSFDLLCIANLDGYLTRINPAFVRVLGYSEDELLARPFVEFLHPEDVAGAVETLRGLAAGVDAVEYEVRCRCKNGSFRWLALTCPAPRAGENTLYAVGRDLTERKLVEKQLRQRDAELAHMSRVGSMGEMAAALAHELNQPLGTIANFAGTCAHLLKSGNWSYEDLLHSIDRINEQALNAGEIIRRLKRFVSQTIPKREQLDINMLVMEVVELMQSTTRQHEVKVITELDHALPNVLVDRVQIQQVLVNLISNALEAMESTDRAARKMVIRTQAADGSVRIGVTDCGCGLKTVEISDIFEPYVTTKNDGLGMGLAISHRIVNAHNGEISAEQNPAGGATFSFTVPSARSTSSIE